MKKLVTPGFKGSVLACCLLLTSLLAGTSSQVQAQGCVMSCLPMDPPLPVGLSSDCEDELTYEMLGAGIFGCPGEITVDILVNGVSIGNTINSSMIGNTYMVIITHTASGQSCMMMIIVVDKQAPLLNCPDDVTLACTTDLTNYTALLPEDISDCSTTTVSIDDQLISSGNCVGQTISQYLRTYTVLDAYNNAAICEQLISLEKADLENVDFPPNLSGPTALSCFPTPDTLPSNTGYPTVNGDDILNGTFCNLTAGFTDIKVPLCSGAYKILRTWTVIDWCAGNQTSTSLQVIEVLDTTAPVVIAPANMTVSTGPLSCSASALLPPADVTDDCSNNWSVRMQGPNGTINSNGGLISGLPIGVHRIIFIATTDCLLSGADTMYVTVQDLQPPSPVCHQSLAIPVNNEGIANVPAYVFDSGSSDNCGSVYFKVKRMSNPAGYTCANPGNPNNLFDDYIQFCCEDINHNNIMVVFRVYDTPPVAGPVTDTYLQGHFNDCMVQVEVQDKLPPQIICPSNLTISCQFPYTPENLDVFGSIAFSEATREQICIQDPGAPGNPGVQCIGLDGLATDNCHVAIEETDPIITINMCGVGTIVRTFVATDDGGLQSSCQQTITVINYNLFDEGDITWPSDLTTFNICEIDLLDPEDLDAPYNQPTLADGPCDLVGSTYDDDVFDFSNSDQACFKILRTWKVIDWCQLNSPTVGIWTHIQVIKVMNNVPPVIAPIEDLDLCSFDPQCGGLTVDFEAQADDDCSGPASISWKYFVDIDNNNSFDYVSGVITGETLQFSRDMPIGTHRVVYTVWDRCGNESTKEQSVTIRSCKPPSAKCIKGLSTSLMAMDTDGDGTADWGMVNLQAEMFDAGSDHPCGNPITVAFSADPQDVSKVYDCSNLGTNEVELWAIDENGLTDFCLTTVEIQDNTGICPPGIGNTGTISGNISVPQAGVLSGAMVYLDGSNMGGIPTGNNGQYVFPAMTLGGEYVVRPVKEGDYKNGVTTLDLVKIQKHLLGIESFSTPFQFIAADANNSSSVTAIDIIQLRKLILGLYSELPSNKSWRFIDKAYVFPNPLNPWTSPWPETYNIIPFANSMNDADFNAIKIGDLNLSANLHADGGKIHPRGNQPCELTYEVNAQPEDHVFRVDVYLTDASQYEALQFSFNWDQVGFTVLDWKPGELLSGDDIRMPQQAGENASLAAFSLNGWGSEKAPLVTLWVKDIGNNGYPFQLFLNPNPTEPVAYKADSDEAIAVQLKSMATPSANVTNRPNPFRDMTTIFMQSTVEEKATLKIFDLSGRQVVSREVSLIKGENEFVVSKTELREPGIYTYEIESNFQYSTNRMIIVD